MMQVKEKTEEGVREGLNTLRQRSKAMFDKLMGLHAIMEDDCNVDLDNARTDYSLDSDDPKIQAWLKDFNKTVDGLMEHDPDGDKKTDYSLGEALEAMTYYITLITLQLVPFDLVRDSCIHHQQHNCADAEGGEGEGPSASSLADALMQALGGHGGVEVRKISLDDLRKLQEGQDEDPFKDIPELGDEDTVIVPASDDSDG